MFYSTVNKIKKRRDNLFDNNELFLQREALRAMRSDDVKVSYLNRPLIFNIVTRSTCYLIYCDTFPNYYT